MILKKLNMEFFTTKEIQPGGWLKKQLEIQAKGLSGNLDKVFPNIRESGWIGGDKDGWEQVPYWLDGFIPLAWLLQDEDLKTRAKKYIDAILENQQKDGWLCPCQDKDRPAYDMWALFLVCKALVLYQDCSGDKRIEEAVYRALKNLDTHMDKNSLFNWGSARWFECLIPLYWLYERRPESWMEDLMLNLCVQGFDYKSLFQYWRNGEAKKRWNYTSHVVNLAMAIKSQALFSRFSGDDSDAFGEEAFQILMRDHGMACGHFTGDECLAGISPIHGSELCSVVEAMYSYEWLLATTGKAKWADRLEALAYNALPATLTPDMWAHQFDQMSNQVECTVIEEEFKPFYTNKGDSHLFGLNPNGGSCCTVNFNQGWPKFALSTFMRTSQGVAIGAIAPATLVYTQEASIANIEILTNYPFADSYTVTVQTNTPMNFSLDLRIPAGAQTVTVNGKPVTSNGYYTINKIWQGKETLQVQFSFPVEYVANHLELYSVKRGPLVYALPIDEEKTVIEYVRNGIERKAPYCDYELRPKSAWNYGFTGDTLEFHQGDMTELPFSPDGTPVSITAKVRPVQWSFEHGLCAEQPESRKPEGPEKKVRLIPYGCTNLRMTEMPVCEK